MPPAESHPFSIALRRPRSRRLVSLRTLGWMLLLGLSAFFLAESALPYFSINPESYGRFWPRAPWLLAHVIGGTLALLLGPLQFWSSARVRYRRLHRLSGRVYLGGIALATPPAFYLSFHTGLFAFGVGLFVLGILWPTSAALAYVAIRNGQIRAHREWMIRSYVLTLTFVSFRFLLMLAFMLELGEPRDVVPAVGYVAVIVPLFVTEVALRWRETTQPVRRRTTAAIAPAEVTVVERSSGTSAVASIR